MEGFYRDKRFGTLDRAELYHETSSERAGQMATTYLSAAAAAAAAANYHHYTAAESAESASAAAAVAMNLVNSSAAASAGYCSPRSTGSESGAPGSGGPGMPEMKYQPPPTSSAAPTPTAASLAVQNGAVAPHPLAHNPWVHCPRIMGSRG